MAKCRCHWYCFVGKETRAQDITANNRGGRIQTTLLKDHLAVSLLPGVVHITLLVAHVDFPYLFCVELR